MEIKKDKSTEEILRDTKHNKKANELFLKLLAKNKVKANPFGRVEEQAYYPIDDKIGPGGNPNDSV